MFYGLHRPEGCLLLSTNSQRTQKVGTVWVQRASFWVQCSSKWAGPCTLTIHKAFKAHLRISEETRSYFNIFFGRFSADRKDRMGLHVKHARQTPAVPLFGIYDSSLQVSPQAFQTDPVVRSNNMFPVHKSLTELIAWSHLLLHVSMYHINNLELKAAFLALQCFLSKL